MQNFMAILCRSNDYMLAEISFRLLFVSRAYSNKRQAREVVRRHYVNFNVAKGLKMLGLT